MSTFNNRESSERIAKAAAFLSRNLSSGTQRAYAEKATVKNRSGKPLSADDLEAVHNHVFSGTKTHEEAKKKSQALIDAHRDLGYGDGDE